MSVKLRHTDTNAKLSRNPYHLEQAIVALANELVGLNGVESLYRVMGDLAHLVAEEEELEDMELINQ